jgi:hypothetical protein
LKNPTIKVRFYVTIQQFALLNQFALPVDMASGPPYTRNSFPISVSYAPGSVPSGAAAPLLPSIGCQGLNFDNQGGDNEALLDSIIKANVAGFYVFSAPWETVSGLLANINNLKA